MKFNKIAKKFAATALAGVLAVSMMGMSVSAAGSTSGTETNPVESVSFTKYVLTDGDTYAPNTTFYFTVTPAEAGTDNDGNTTKAGVVDGLTASNVNFTPDTTSETSSTYSASGTLTVDASKFSSEGIYHYTMTENDVTYEGITKDSTVYDIYVHVYNTTDMTDIYVAYVTVVKTVDGVATKSDLVFSNDYGADDDINSTHDVTVTKNITGTAANTSDTFSFNVSVSGENGEAYKIVYTQSGVKTTTYVLSGETKTLTGIGQNDTITIYGLTETDVYTITETDGVSQGYDADGSVTGSATSDGTTATITNNKDFTTPTGIALSIAPYVLMVAFAGVIAVLFLRKRNYEI